ncbi:MAG TPA: SLC13 family permease [Candidatus Anaerobiospirillum stercoravium]|nr:SLC13 family permease [Candidatus Anaerobiospirillum stercoravium]
MDHSQAIITLVVLAVVAFLFVTELIPLAVTAIGASVTLGFLGVLSPSEVFSGLSNSTVVLFAGMFVVGAAMLESGLAQTIGNSVVKRVGTKELPLMIALMVLTIMMSSFASNTGTVACLLPVIIGICVAAKIPSSALLMGLAIAANTGGTITMVGTPPNIIAAGALDAAGIPKFGFFEFAWIGIPLSIMSVLYMVFIGRKLIPQNYSDVGAISNVASAGTPRARLICLAILFFVIMGLIFGIPGLTQEMVAIVGALACVLFGCLSEKKAYQGIDWVTIFLFAGMLPISTALEKTGAGAMIADEVVGLVGDNPSPYLFMSVLFCLSCGLTQFMSNTAAAALLCPIGISIANKMGCSPYPVLMAIAIAASCAFTTPVATPPNTLVMAPGKFKFIDYIKVGVPLVVLSLIICVVIIPMVWPFYPEA